MGGDIPIVNISTCSPAWQLVRKRERVSGLPYFLLTAVLPLIAVIIFSIFCARYNKLIFSINKSY